MLCRLAATVALAAILFGGLGVWHRPARAQDAAENAAETKAEAEKPAAKEKKPPSPAQVAFNEKLGEWKRLLSELRGLQLKYKVAKPADRPALEGEFTTAIKQADAMAPIMVELAEKAYVEDPNQDDELSKFLVSRAYGDLVSDRYAESLHISQLLADHDFPNPATTEWAGICAFVLNDYDAAEKYFAKAKEKKALKSEGQALADAVSQYREYWAREQELRKAEAEADDLPRVLLKTTKGDLEIELYENEAPNTVANFINLVEKGFYKDLPFHRVIHGFMAQGGDPKGDGTGGPGYSIADECESPNHRIHFSDTLSMAKSARKDSGGSQFFITFRPTPHLNGKHTVFGRVIKGNELLPLLQEADPQRKKELPSPDKILEAKVLRKRNHDYKPQTLPEVK